MIRLLVIVSMLFVCLPSFAGGGEQNRNVFVNTQLHRDFHREIYTSTVEFFGLDQSGTTFFFADFDFGSEGQTGSYFEISRNLAVYRHKLAVANLSLQFNDGVLSGDAPGVKQIPRTVLFGPAVSDLNLGGATLELQALLRQEFGVDPGWQLTLVWFWPLPALPLEFLGCVDWNSNETGDNPTSVQTEPQLQFRWHQLAVGTEVEISRNFTGAWTEKHGFEFHTWYAHPTVYLRWDL